MFNCARLILILLRNSRSLINPSIALSKTAVEVLIVPSKKRIASSAIHVHCWLQNNRHVEEKIPGFFRSSRKLDYYINPILLGVEVPALVSKLARIKLARPLVE